MSSPGAAITALDGRGLSVSSANSDYRIVLPPLPAGVIVRNSVLLHGDVSARPYKIGDFRAALERLGVIEHIEAIGAYQMNHLWMVTFKTEDAKLRLVAAKELEVKGKRCLVVDPDNADARMKLHWLPFHVPDEAVRKALEPYGKVKDLTRDKWRAQGFTGVQSTTRLVRLSLKEGVTIERLPHQLRIAGGNVLVVVPGRAPVCLRCKLTGHIRRECPTPRCDECHRFGHERDKCARTYATVTQEVMEDEDRVLRMDEEEAEEAARDVASEVSATASAKEAQAAVPKEGPLSQRQPDEDAVTPGPALASSSSPVFSSEIRDSIPKDGEACQVAEPGSTSPACFSDENSDMSDTSETFKRPMDAAARSELKWRKLSTRRERFNPKPRIPTEERHRSAPP